MMADLFTVIASIVVILVLAVLFRYLQFPCKDAEPEVKNRHKAFVALAERKRVTLVSNMRDLSTAWDAFSSDLRGVLGLDCEWTTTDEVVGPISLLQMALPTGACLLVRICCLEQPVREAFPPSLCQMLADPKVLKFGVGITFDAAKFMKDHALPMRGCVDLRHLVVRVRNNGLPRRGLKNIARVWLGIEYESSKEVQCSVWDQQVLSPVQVEYAAMDGVVAIYAVMEFLYRKRKLPQPGSAEALQADLESLDDALVRPLCQGVIDCRFKARQFDQNRQNASRVAKAAEQKAYRIPQRTRPLYTNAAMLAPDGQLLCMMDVRKAQWYLDKGLASLEEEGGDVSTEPRMTIRLKFEPSARETGADWEYYTSVKVNQCAVCGSGAPFARKHVVPLEYRRAFPQAHKFHKSHDVLLFCLPCHRQSNLADEALRRCLAEEFDAPLGTRVNLAYVKDERAVGAMRAAKALRVSGEKIPAARRAHLEAVVRDFCAEEEGGAPPPLEECLARLQEAPPAAIVRNESFVPHGEAVVAALRETEDGVAAFERRWRQHFVDTMMPQHLPAGWSVDHRLARTG